MLFRFQNLGDVKKPYEFYSYDNDFIYLNETAIELLTSKENSILMNEVDSRWSLLEASFLMSRENFELENDIRLIYLQNGYERKNITGNVHTLNGYQEGRCFYCGEPLDSNDIHVDHVIPRQFIYHDEVWNLVLAHSHCNFMKSDLLPPRAYIEKLKLRNEHLIASNHPIKNKLIQQLGLNPRSRSQYVEKEIGRASCRERV